VSAGPADAGPADAGPDRRLGLTVTHRRYVPHSAAHYGGALVDGAYVLALFGDVATELSIRTDGDEGLLAGYRELTFLGPVRAGDVVQVGAVLTRVGRRSRELTLTAEVLCRARPGRGPSAADVLDPPLAVATARATVVVPAAR
jgi:3-aminobutyryl-CoA ammonia-lyase